MIRPVPQALEEPLAAQPQVQVEQQAQVRDLLAQAARLDPVQPVPVEPLVQAARRVVLAEPVVQVRPVALVRPVRLVDLVAVPLVERLAELLVERLAELPAAPVLPVDLVAVRLVVAVRLAVAQVLVRRLRLLPIRSLP